jgi:uncharacterized membrane protein
MRISRLLILLLIALAFLQVNHYAPLLPERVASHFDAAGRADGWSAKGDFLAMNLIFVVGMALLFLGVTVLINRVPNDWINLPNKDYWLAPERRALTLNAISGQMEWLAAATVALLIGLTQLTIEANLASAAALPGYAFWLFFGGYMAFMVVWLVRLLRKWYARPPGDAPPEWGHV